MKMIIKKVLLTSMYGLVLACLSCGRTDVGLPEEKLVDAHESSQQSPGAHMTGSAIGSGMDQHISDAVVDLSARAGIDEDSIKISQARAVSWGSSALGCPQDGMNYTQAIVPGLLLILEADGHFYNYHGRTGGSLFYCPKERAEAPAYESGKEVI